MASNASRGAYYRGRSKRHIERLGYEVFTMELTRVVWTPNGPIPTKRDQLGADLAYMDDDVVVFVQVKSGARSEQELVREATLAFAQHRFARHTRRVVHVWRPGARVPIEKEIVDDVVEEGRKQAAGNGGARRRGRRGQSIRANAPAQP